MSDGTEYAVCAVCNNEIGPSEVAETRRQRPSGETVLIHRGCGRHRQNQLTAYM